MAAGKNKPQGNATAPAAFVLNDNHKSLLAEIDTATKAGQVRYVSKAEAGELAANGFVKVDPSNLDSNGNAAASLTEAGTKELPPMTETNTAPVAAAGATPAVTFKIATVAPPAIVRKAPTGGGRAAKYPLADLQVGQAIFIPADASADVKKLSKSFGSMVAGFNKSHPDVYLTSRGLEDGAAAGFGDEYKGVKGTGIYREDVSKRPVRKPRKAKGETAPATAEAAPATAETAPAAAAE